MVREVSPWRPRTHNLTSGAEKLTQFAVLFLAFSFDTLRRYQEEKTDRLLFEERGGDVERNGPAGSRTQVGLVLVGMPGLEKRLARDAQFYSRIGFVHEFRPLSVSQVRQLLEQRWTPPGVTLPAAEPLDDETIAAIVRVAGVNFRLLHRLLTQMERILEINKLNRVIGAVVEAARESLVIGQV